MQPLLQQAALAFGSAEPKAAPSIWIDRVQLRCCGPQRGSQRLFTESEFLDRVDVNEDGRVDQLDLRVLLRYLSGLRGSELAEQEVSEEIIQVKTPTSPNWI